MHKDLVIFTSSYPFGTHETFLHDEVKILARHFNKIIIHPHYYKNKDTTERSVPDNVIVIKPAYPLSKKGRIIRCLIGILKKGPVLFVLKEIIVNKLFYPNKKILNLLIYIFNYYATIGSKQFNVVKNYKNKIFYFYWGNGWANISPLIDKRLENTINIRLHGAEVFKERSGGYLPLRNLIFSNSDRLILISETLKEYIVKNYSFNTKKLIISRLGVNKLFKEKKEKLYNNCISIVSCSNLIKLKRVDLIIESLSLIKDRHIKWIHIGDGIENDKLQKVCNEKFGDNIEYEFMGWIKNEKIHELYSNNHFDVFVNVSLHEGLPFSIMEAFAYGIPTIATDVGGTKDIVNEKNGILLPSNFSNETLSKIICETNTQKWTKKSNHALKTWTEYYNANKNYNELSHILKSD